MIGRDREVQAADAGSVAGAGGRLDELFLERGPDGVGDPVEFEQSFRPRREAEARFVEQTVDHRGVCAAGDQSLGIEAGGGQSAGQGREEGEPAQPGHELEGGTCVAVALAGSAGQHRLRQRRQARPHAQQRPEHPGGCARRRHEFHAAAGVLGSLVRQTVAFRQDRIDANDAVIEAAGAGERDRRRRVAEETQLAGQRRVADTAAFEVGAIGGPYHLWFRSGSGLRAVWSRPHGRHRGILQGERRD